MLPVLPVDGQRKVPAGINQGLWWGSLASGPLCSPTLHFRPQYTTIPRELEHGNCPALINSPVAVKSFMARLALPDCNTWLQSPGPSGKARQ